MGRIGHKAIKYEEGNLSGWLWREDFEHVQQHHEVFFLESKEFQNVHPSYRILQELVMGIDAQLDCSPQGILNADEKEM